VSTIHEHGASGTPERTEIAPHLLFSTKPSRLQHASRHSRSLASSHSRAHDRRQRGCCCTHIIATPLYIAVAEPCVTRTRPSARTRRARAPRQQEKQLRSRRGYQPGPRTSAVLCTLLPMRSADQTPGSYSMHPHPHGGSQRVAASVPPPLLSRLDEPSSAHVLAQTPSRNALSQRALARTHAQARSRNALPYRALATTSRSALLKMLSHTLTHRRALVRRRALERPPLLRAHPPLTRPRRRRTGSPRARRTHSGGATGSKASSRGAPGGSTSGGRTAAGPRPTGPRRARRSRALAWCR